MTNAMKNSIMITMHRKASSVLFTIKENRTWNKGKENIQKREDLKKQNFLFNKSMK